MVIGYAAYSFINCFSGYHQVRIHENDRYKTTFITEWGVICMGRDAFWFKECSTDTPEDRQPDLQGVFERFYEVVFGRL